MKKPKPHQSLFIALGFLLLIRHKNSKIDFQNIYRCANQYLPILRKRCQTRQKIIEQQHRMVFILLDWRKILGPGYTTKHPNKLMDIYNLYHNQKTDKLFRYHNKHYYDPNINNLKAYSDWLKDMFNFLICYIMFANAYWNNKSSDILKKFDKTYYEFALTIYKAYISHLKDKKLNKK